jgi:hypothetical protein
MLKLKYNILTDMDIEEVCNLSSLIGHMRKLRDISEFPIHNDPVMIYSRWQNQQDCVIFARLLYCPPAFNIPNSCIYSWDLDQNRSLRMEIKILGKSLYLDVQLSHDPSRNTSFPP